MLLGHTRRPPTLGGEIGKAFQNWCHLSCHLKGEKKLFSNEGGVVGEEEKNAGVWSTGVNVQSWD